MFIIFGCLTQFLRPCAFIFWIHHLLILLSQGHKPKDAIDVDASDAVPVSSSSASTGAPRRARLSQISGLDPWAQQAFMRAGETSGRSAYAPPPSDGTER
jgi:hypothetical protein